MVKTPSKACEYKKGIFTLLRLQARYARELSKRTLPEVQLKAFTQMYMSTEDQIGDLREKQRQSKFAELKG